MLVNDGGYYMSGIVSYLECALNDVVVSVAVDFLGVLVVVNLATKKITKKWG